MCVSVPCAFAKSVSFGSEEEEYTLSFDEKWAVEERPNGVELFVDGNASSILVSVVKNEGLPLSTMQADAFFSSLKLTDMKKNKRKNGVFLSGVKEGKPVFIELLVEDDLLLTFVGVGLGRKDFDLVRNSCKKQKKSEQKS
ncbi:MAG: hypothetical protein K5657_02810 [Desulfovibrio sp.]|nr:hypothetical protein [Desulfovibrio sp.]